VAAPDLSPMATAVGEAWASELVLSLRSAQRNVVGEWPGTMGEARMRIRIAVRRRIDIDVLDELARVANLAARRGWIELRNHPRIAATGAPGKAVPVRD
jgi:hypothetical protein